MRRPRLQRSIANLSQVSGIPIPDFFPVLSILPRALNNSVTWLPCRGAALSSDVVLPISCGFLFFSGRSIQAAL